MTQPFLKRKINLGRAGFSLIELVIMIAVASALLVGMGRAVQSQIKMATDNRDYLIALDLAKQQMAVMNEGAYPAVGTTTPAPDAAFPGFTFSQVVTSVAVSGSKSIRQIQMDVLKGSTVLVRLYTYRSDLITFGNGS